jgi:galactonate dehydratase
MRLRTVTVSLTQLFSTPHSDIGSKKPPFRFAKGTSMFPRALACWVDLDLDALAGKIGHDWRNRELYDANDGSVVDW